MPGRTPYDAWLQKEQRRRRREREFWSSLVLLFILAFWAGVIWGLTAIF